jgi:hypothetical protein
VGQKIDEHPMRVVAGVFRTEAGHPCFAISRSRRPTREALV